MGKFFALITQIRNRTDRPDKTGTVYLYRILRCFREHGSDWKIRVLVDNPFTGIELDPMILLDCTRVVFGYVDGSDDILCVEGVLENCSDFWLRLEYFGWMRNIFWDGREQFPIDRGHSRVAAKLSSSILTPSASPIKHEEKRKRDSPVYATVDRKINDRITKDRPNVPPSPEKSRILPPPPAPPPLPPSPPPQTRSREQYSVAEDLSDEDFWRDIADDSSSDTSTDHVSRAGNNIGWRVGANSPVRREIGGSDGGLQRARREQTTTSTTVNHHDIAQRMDGFEFAFLFFVAFTFVLLLSKF